jgi:micrococcal nuclease
LEKLFIWIDDAKHYDKYGRTLAVVYVDDVNLNVELLKRGYEEVLYNFEIA